MLEINVDSYNRTNTTIKLDGVILQNVVSIDLHIDGDELPTVMLKVLPEHIKITGNVKIIKSIKE